jgi:hypothetical protein
MAPQQAVRYSKLASGAIFPGGRQHAPNAAQAISNKFSFAAIMQFSARDSSTQQIGGTAVSH